jgi:hypothetical protein
VRTDGMAVDKVVDKVDDDLLMVVAVIWFWTWTNSQMVPRSVFSMDQISENWSVTTCNAANQMVELLDSVTL